MKPASARLVSESVPVPERSWLRRSRFDKRCAAWSAYGEVAPARATLPYSTRADSKSSAAVSYVSPMRYCASAPSGSCSNGGTMRRYVSSASSLRPASRWTVPILIMSLPQRWVLGVGGWYTGPMGRLGGGWPGGVLDRLGGGVAGTGAS